MKIDKGILLALVVVAASPIKSWAVDGQAIQIQGTNIVLSWPSLGHEYYMIQYWPDLASPSVQLTVDPDRLVNDCYASIREIMEVSRPVQHSKELMLYRFDAGDFLIGFHPKLQHLLDSKKSGGRSELFHLDRIAFDRIDNMVPGPDGIILIPGQSWPEDR